MENIVADASESPVITNSSPQFTILADLGIITVPEDYNHATFLVSFRTRHQGGRKKSFWSYNEGITDANFRNPSRVLKSGDKLSVRAFRQIVSRTISKERMTFLKEQDAVLVGAQGAALVFDHKRDQLPKGYWYASMDQPDRLWEDAGRSHRVPEVLANHDGNFYFSLGCFEDGCYDLSALLVFCDVPAPSGA